METPAAPLKLRPAMEALRPPGQLRSARALLWRDLLTSLWAPISILGLVFLPYLLLIELHPPSAAWAQPAMQYLALALFLFFLGLLAWRLTSSREKRLRKLRHDARELISEIDGLVARAGDKLGSPVRARLAEQALRLEAAMLTNEAAAMERELKALGTLADEHLTPYRRHSRLDAASGFVKALAIALLIRTVLIEPYKIPSGSMLPTLEIGDQVFVNKFIYGVRVPFLNYVPFVIVREPRRGDVIVFNNPKNESKDFIKRVVGVPGDTIEIVDEVVYINGRPQERELRSDDFVVFNQEGGRWFSEQAALYQEDLMGHLHPVLQNDHPPRSGSREGPYVVPEGHVFVLGDNRDNSMDSRYGLGEPPLQAEYVPYGHIKGKAMVIWLALGHGGLFHGLFGGTGLRTDRLFLPVR